MVVSPKLRQENFTDDNTDERKRMLEKQKQLEKTVKSWDKAESLPQIIGGVRRRLDELVDSHPEKIFIEVGMFQADTFIQHLLTKRTVAIVVANDTNFAVVAGEACLQVQISV